MFKKIFPLLLTIVFISSCNGQSFREVTDPSVRIDIRGASVLPPQEKAWKIIQKNENQLSLIKGDPQSDATYAAFVMINELPDIESEEQFSEISKKLLSEYDTERFTIKKEEGEISYSRETYCWRYHMISEDRAAKTRTGQKVMLLEMIGYICQHPKDRKKGINFSYSHRYYPGDEDPKIKNKAKEFLDNVTFTDFISESTTSIAESKAKPYYNRGLTYLRKSRFDEAIIELTKAIELNPKYAIAYYNRGLVYGKKGQLDKAISDNTKAIELNPKYAWAYYDRGLAFYTKGHIDKAISDYTKAIEIDPWIDKAYYNRGLAYHDKGQIDLAISDYTEAIELNPKHLYAYNNRGNAYRAKGQYDQAISDYTKAIEINPKHAKVYKNRGFAYLKKGQHDHAISDCNKAIEIDPRDPYAYHYRGSAYLNKGKYDQAISDYNEAIELNPKYLKAYISRGYAYKLKGQYEQAISDYNKAIDINPKSPIAYNNKAWILATCVDARYRDGERALKLSQNAVELSLTSAYLDTLAAAYAEAGKFKDAITTQEKFIALLKKEGKAVTVEIIERLEFYKSNKPWRERPSKVERVNKAEEMEARDFKVTVITDLDGVRQFDIERVKRETKHALDSISSFLGITEGKAIEVRIVSEGIVRTSGGVVFLPERYVKNKKAAIVLTISYILTKHYENNFFRVGLGVHFQERFGEDDGFPNFTGEPLNDLVRRYKDQLMPIDKLSSNNEIFGQVGTTKRRIAFIEAGSFIGFLVEKYGVQKIRELHNSRTIDYGRAYGKNIKELEAEWREFVFG